MSQLGDFYYEIRAGLGVTKNPAEYGAFPIDPYSHTPGNAGVQQPGMTGQVKEDILCRWGELGIVIEEGRIRFWPELLRRSEFAAEATEFHWLDHSGAKQTLPLAAGSLAFTYCQTPIIYCNSSANQIHVALQPNRRQIVEGLRLDRELSGEIFRRSSRIRWIQVELSPGR